MAVHRFTLFMTVPACVVVATMCAWLIILLKLVPSLSDAPILPFGGVFDLPVAARFVASLDFSSAFVPSQRRLRQERALRESMMGWDMAGLLSDLGDWPFPPMPSDHRLIPVDPRILLRDMLVFDLDSLRSSEETTVEYHRPFRRAQCRDGHHREVIYVNRGAVLHFHGSARRSGSIEVADSLDPACLLTHLHKDFSFRCRIPTTNLYNITYHRLRHVNVTITHFRFGAGNAPLCHGPCTLPLRWSWTSLYHRMVVVPHILACVPHGGKQCPAGCLEAGFFQGSTHFTIDWRVIATLCLVLQFGCGGVALALLWPHLRRVTTGQRLQRSSAPHYHTFGHRNDEPRQLPPLFEEPEAARCLAAFVLFGFLGIHRIYRILKDPLLSRSSKALDCILVFMLGPLFFARDGLCFADFLYEDLIDLATVDELKHLEHHMATHAGVVVAEQPERNVAYAFFLSPLYWLLLIRVADLCNGNMMGDQVYLSLLGCGLIIFVLWLLSPSSFVIWSGQHGTIIIARQWLCRLQVWVTTVAMFQEARCRLEWSSDKLVIHSHFLPAGQFLRPFTIRLHALHDLLHCLPLVFQLLRTPFPPLDLLLPNGPHPSGPRLAPPSLPPSPLSPDNFMFPAQGSPTPPCSPLSGQGDLSPPPPLLPIELWLRITTWLPLTAFPAVLTTCRVFATFRVLEVFWGPHAELMADGRPPPMSGMTARSRCYLYNAQRHPERQFSFTVVSTALLPYAGSTYVWRFTPPPHAQELHHL